MEEDGEFEPPTKVVDKADRPSNPFADPTVIQSAADVGAQTIHDRPIGVPVDTSHDTRTEVGSVPVKDDAPRTLIKRSEAGRRPLAPTLVRPLTTREMQQALDEPMTVVPGAGAPPSSPDTPVASEPSPPASPSVAASESPTASPPSASSQSAEGPSMPVMALIGAAIVGLALGVIGVTVWALTGDARDPDTSAHVESGEAHPDRPAQDVLEPLAEAPPLRDAAGLAISGRFEEAARAYAALAREHPGRPELAAMARVLRSKVGR